MDGVHASTQRTGQIITRTHAVYLILHRLRYPRKRTPMTARQIPLVRALVNLNDDTSAREVHTFLSLSHVSKKM
jgi:hypothetical protein